MIRVFIILQDETNQNQEFHALLGEEEDFVLIHNSLFVHGNIYRSVLFDQAKLKRWSK